MSYEGKIYSAKGLNSNKACIGWGDVNSDFYTYINGYKNAADNLIKVSIGTFSEMDKLVFPICFLYRQWLELYLKYIFLKFIDKPIEEKKTIIKKNGHKILKLWQMEIKPFLQSYEDINESGQLKRIEKYIKEIDENDKYSFVYRFPIDLKLNRLHPETKEINLKNLKSKFDKICIFFDSIGIYIFEKNKFEKNPSFIIKSKEEYC